MFGCSEFNWGSGALCHKESEHLIVTVPEPYTGTFGPDRALSSNKPRRNNTVAIPYFSHVHYGPRAYAADLDLKSISERKHSRAAMNFSLSRKSQLRVLLLEQCALHPDACKAISELPHADELKIEVVHELLNNYHSSWFLPDASWGHAHASRLL